MAGELGRAVLELATEGREFTKGLADAQHDAEGFGSRVGAIGKAALLGLAGVAVGVVGTMGVAVKAAAEEEEGIFKLAQAVHNAGGDWDVLQQGIEDTLAAQERQTAWSTGEQREALALLVALTGDTDEAMRRLGPAMDLARGAGIDLTTASRLLGKATDENVQVLKRYGISLKEGADTTDLLEAVQKRFAGQSAAYAGTVAGQWKIVQEQVGHLAADFGAVLLPVATFVLQKLLALVDAARAGFERARPVITSAIVDPFYRAAYIIPRLLGAIGEIFDVLTGRRPEAGGVLRELVGGERAEDIMGIVGRVRDTLTEGFDVIAGVVQKVIDKVETLRQRFADLPPVIQAAFAGAALGAVTGFNDALLGTVANVATALGGLAQFARAVIGMDLALVILQFQLWGLAVGEAGVAFGTLLLAALPFILLGAAIAVLIYLLVTHWEELGDTIHMVGAIIGDFVGRVLAQIGAMVAWWEGVWREFSARPIYWVGVLLGLLIGGLLNIAQAIGDFAGNVLKAIGDLLGAVGTAWSDFWTVNTPLSLGIGLASLLVNIGVFVLDALGTIGQWLADTGTAIGDFFGALPARMRQFGEDIVRGLWNGMLGFKDWLLARIGEFIQGILDGIRAALGAHSPAEATMPLGASMVEGLAQGIIDAGPIAIGAMRALVAQTAGVTVVGTFGGIGGTTGGGGGDMEQIDRVIKEKIDFELAVERAHFGTGDLFHAEQRLVNEIHVHMDGREIAAAVGDRTVRGAALAGAPIG
jgi:hypothetical protein